MTTFHTTTDEKEFREIFSLCGTEWAGTATSQQFGDLYTKALLKHAAKGVNPRGFMLRDQKTKELLTCVIVERYKGYFKSVDKSSVLSSNAPPDPSSIGVNSVTFLHVGYVFTEKDQRGKGLAESLIKKAIEYTEKEIIEDEIAKSNPKKKDNFKSMVTNDDNGIDYKLANYYLGKKYFWYLYSAVSTFYERFGFKGYPLEAYKIPLQPNGEAEELLHQILKTGSTAGKKLRFLRRSNKQDLALIEFIFQSKELEILTELNKNISHSELFGSSNSQSSLTNMSDILTMGNLQLGLSLTSISETTTGGSTGVRRKSSVVHQAIPKVAIKPILDIFDSNAEVSIQYASYSATTDNQEAVQFADIQGQYLPMNYRTSLITSYGLL